MSKQAIEIDAEMLQMIKDSQAQALFNCAVYGHDWRVFQDGLWCVCCGRRRDEHPRRLDNRT